MYKKDLPSLFNNGIGLNSDFRDLDVEKIGCFDAMITSPPFMGMRFDKLAKNVVLWMVGGRFP